jgi:hypothetical protein
MDPLEKLKRLCREQKDDMAAFMLSGGAQDYPAYCKAVGAAQALELVLNEIADIEKALIEE